MNGAGKTTLVTLLARLRDPTAGRITVDGVPLADLDPRSWQRQVAVVYQDFTRYPLSLRDNVALRDLGAEIDEAALRRSVEMAGATALVEGLPHGWGTVLSSGYRNGTDLSGGQWQRVALARALYSVARGATLLVLDEPTAQLDVRAEAAFYDRFLELTAGVTTLVISHRFSTVRRAERIAVLDQGRITEIGSHDELWRPVAPTRPCSRLRPPISPAPSARTPTVADGRPLGPAAPGAGGGRPAVRRGRCARLDVLFGTAMREAPGPDGGLHGHGPGRRCARRGLPGRLPDHRRRRHPPTMGAPWWSACS